MSDKKEKKADATIKGEVVLVTPALAAEWLAANHEEQRPVATRRVQSFANDMIAEKWVLTHQGIAFDGNDRLIDGQHRLQAVVLSGKSVLMYVFRNSAASIHDPLDRGGPRTMGQIVGMSNRVSAALGILSRLESGEIRSHVPVTASEIIGIADRHRKWIDLALGGDGRWSTAGFGAACIWTMPIDEEATLDFMSKVHTGEMIKRGDPSYQYRKWNKSQIKHSGIETALAVINCLRFHIQGKTLGTVHTTETGYRGACSKRRAMRVANTPGTDAVESLSWTGGGASKE